MNESTTGIVVCESMHEAIKECITSLEGSFRIYPIIPSCTFIVGVDLFRHYLERSIVENDITLLAYGTCHPQILELLAEYGNQVIKVKGNNCYEMCLGTEKYTEYHRKCYWMLNKPFFTKWKKDIFVGWGVGTVNGKMMIGEAYKKLVYLRFEKDQLDINLVEDFANTVGLEYEVYPIDTDNLKRLLEEALASASQIRRRNLPASSLMHPSQPDVQTILDNIGEIIYRIDVHTKEFSFISPQVKTILGYTQAEFIDILNNHVIVPLYHEDEREKVMIGRYNFLIKCLNERMQEPHQMEYRVKHKNGNLLWVRESVYPTYSSEGVIESFVGKIVDITERKRVQEALRKAHDNMEVRVKERTAELEGLTEELKNEILERQQVERDLNQLNRAYLMVCECNQELIRIADEQSLLNNICKIIIGTGGYRLVWVGFTEHDENKTVLPVASAGYEKGYLESLDITWADEPRGRGPTGTAIRTGKPTIARNILTDPQFAPWRDRAVKCGYASSIALPLHMDNKNIGGLNIYASEPEAFDDEEVDLLIKLADNLSYGISSLRIRTERNRAEEALRESEELYRTLVETAPSGVSMTDLEGQLIYVSQRIVELYGYERTDELLGRSALDLIAPEDREKAIVNIQKTLEEGSLREQEIILLKKDGTQFIGGVNATALKGADGRPRAFITTTRDITKRKRAEEARRESEGKYRSLVESTDDVVYLISRDMRYEFANSKYLSRLGLSLAELVGQEYGKLHPWDAKKEFEKKVDQVIKSGKPMTYEYLSYRDNKYFMRTLSPVTGEKPGEIKAITVTSKDITEHKRAEEELRESEDKYRTIFENVSDSITYIDKYGTIISANDKEEIFGRKPEEIIGKRFTELGYFDVKDIPKYITLLKNVITGKKTLMQMELEVKHKDGHKFPVEMSTSLVKRDGKTVGFVCISRDITERKRTEEALRESEGSLAEAQRIGRIGNWDLDLVKNELKWSDEIYRIFGLKPQKFGATYEAFLDAVHPDDREYVDTMYIKSVESSTPYDIVHRIIRKSDGEVRYVHEKCEHSKDQTGKMLRSIGTVQDITALKRVENELKATQEQLRNLSTHLQSVREEDRASLAREIHDELGQALMVLKFGLLELKNALPADKISLVEKITSMAEYIDAIAQTVNKIATQLRPTLLDELGLVEAIEWEVEQFEDRTGIKCELTIEPEEIVIDQDRSTAIYRIVQEALTNIARHAQTTRSAVSLKMSDGKLHLSITDKGIGITEDKVLNPKALGIIGMRERVLSVGGNFKISGIKGRGTKVRVIIPAKVEDKVDDKNSYRG